MKGWGTYGSCHTKKQEMITSAWEVLTKVMNGEKEMSVNVKITVGGVLKVKAMNIK